MVAQPGSLTFNTVITKLKAGQQIFSNTLIHPDLEAAKKACEGQDFIWIEMQHSTITWRETQQLIKVVAEAGCIPFVRVPSANVGDILKACDAGTLGIVVPMVESVEEARNAVLYSKFPIGHRDSPNARPWGKRSSGQNQAKELWGDGYATNANNNILVMIGANAGLSPQDVRDASRAIQDAHVTLCQLETPTIVALEAFRVARAAGVRTVLTPAPASELPDELLRLCDLCVPNKNEAELLTGRKIESLGDAESAARILLERGVRAVVVTMGSLGALFVDSDGVLHVPAVEVVAVDPTGAGDAFTAAIATTWAEGRPLRDAAQIANVVAALTVTRIGTQTAFPSRAEVEKWLASPE